LVFEVELRAEVGAHGVRRLGDRVRQEGSERRLVYVAVGNQAGDAGSPWSRRMKIDMHTIGSELVAAAERRNVLEVVVAGTGPDGTPSCATARPLEAWRAV
jgi:hypothetical protein